MAKLLVTHSNTKKKQTATKCNVMVLTSEIWLCDIMVPGMNVLTAQKNSFTKYFWA